MPTSSKYSNEGVTVSQTDAEKSSNGGSTAVPVIDELAERRLVAKLDLMVVPPLCLIYFLSFLDRSNIGNAKIMGMTEELRLDEGSRYNIALMFFFIPYILFEVPSNAIIKHVRPSMYLSGLVTCWGLCNMCMGFVHHLGPLTILRFLLGLFEAGLLPGIVYVLSMYYRRFEYQKRLAVVFSAVFIAGVVSGLLAYAIAHLDGRAGYRAWRWIFIIEGAATCGIGILMLFFVPDWPEQNRRLSAAEKELQRQRMLLDEVREMNHLTRTTAKLILTDPKLWLACVSGIGIGTIGYAQSFFLPTILKEFGWKAIDAQVHAIPVHAVPLALIAVSSWLSDKLQHRFAFVFGPLVPAVIGISILLDQSRHSSGVKYLATFMISVHGLAMPGNLTWIMNNLDGHWNRSFGAAIVTSFANFGGIVASNIFLAREMPKYKTGYSVTLALTVLSLLSSTTMAIYLVTENKKRDQGKRDHRLDLPPEDLGNLGDHHPNFRYKL